jgi:beta-glucosidase
MRNHRGWSRWLAAAAFTVFLLDLSGTAAYAVTYPVHSGRLYTTVNGQVTTALTAGESVLASGGGFAPGARVTVAIHSQPVTLARTSADAAGDIQVTLTIPSSTLSGAHTLTATGNAPGGGTVILTESITVSSNAGGTTSPTLPFTGADMFAIAAVAGSAVVAGTGSLVLARRRRRLPVD